MTQDQDNLLQDNVPKNTWKDIMLYLGYNLYLQEDVKRLTKNAEWVNTNREKSEKRTGYRPAFIVAVFTMIGSGIITVLGSWIVKIFFSG